MCPYNYMRGYEAKKRKKLGKVQIFLKIWRFCKVHVSEF